MTDSQTDDRDTGGGDAADTGADETVEDRYRRRVGVALAVLAVLGAWIAVLQTNAATNESRTAREATRMASESQRAQVVARGVDSAFEEVLAQSEAVVDGGPLAVAEDAAADAGATVDPARRQARVDDARSTVTGALGDPGDRVRDVRIEARQLSLEQSEVVEERVTWNARASQYETVMTTLGVAIFLVGFTLVVSHKTRPPIAIPALVLAVYCFGWAVHIYLKPIPHVERDAIEAVAVGQVAIDDEQPTRALASFDRAVGIDADYSPGWEGRGIARVVEVNPDLLTSFAVTDTSSRVLDRASADIDEALRIESDPSAETLTGAALVAVVRTDWARAEEFLDRAIEVNELTPGLQLSRVAVLAAQGEGGRARRDLRGAVGKFSDLKGTDTARSLTARYLTLLEWVEANEPDQASLVAELRAEAMGLVSAAAGGDVPDRPPAGGTLTVSQLSYSRGVTTVALGDTGLPPGTPVVIAGYERPAPGAAWVQPVGLFYAGPVPAQSTGTPRALRTPGTCAPVEYRFDLWVGESRLDSITAPGVEPTC